MPGQARSGQYWRFISWNRALGLGKKSSSFCEDLVTSGATTRMLVQVLVPHARKTESSLVLMQSGTQGGLFLLLLSATCCCKATHAGRHCIWVWLYCGVCLSSCPVQRYMFEPICPFLVCELSLWGAAHLLPELEGFLAGLQLHLCSTVSSLALLW